MCIVHSISIFKSFNFNQVQGKWISINDEAISFNETKPVTNDTYILFYQQRTRRIDEEIHSDGANILQSENEKYNEVDSCYQEHSFGSSPPALQTPQVELIDLTEERTLLDEIRARYPTLQQDKIDLILQRYKDIPSEDREKVESIFRFPMRNRYDFVTRNFGGVYKKCFITLRDKAWISGEVKLFLK